MQTKQLMSLSSYQKIPSFKITPKNAFSKLSSKPRLPLRLHRVHHSKMQLPNHYLFSPFRTKCPHLISIKIKQFSMEVGIKSETNNSKSPIRVALRPNQISATHYKCSQRWLHFVALPFRFGVGGIWRKDGATDRWRGAAHYTWDRQLAVHYRDME